MSREDEPVTKEDNVEDMLIRHRFETMWPWRKENEIEATMEEGQSIKQSRF